MSKISVEELLRHLCDDGADFNDCIMGYTRYTFDPATGVLTINFDREESEEAGPNEDFSSAEYKFVLVK